MSALITEDEISQEATLVWLENVDELDYVRQSLDRLPTRRGKPAYHRDGRMIGYAQLGSRAKPSRSSGTFRRRVFWLLPHDRDTDPDGLYATGAPSEAVDPRTLAPGVKGRMTERSKGDPRQEDAPRGQELTRGRRRSRAAGLTVAKTVHPVYFSPA